MVNSRLLLSWQGKLIIIIVKRQLIIADGGRFRIRGHNLPLRSIFTFFFDLVSHLGSVLLSLYTSFLFLSLRIVHLLFILVVGVAADGRR